MALARKPKNQRRYKVFTRQAKQRDCDFCNFSKAHDQVVESTRFFWVVHNIFPYDIWDSSGVVDHLMVVPKRHVDAIGHFTPKEQAAFTKVLGKYDRKGYSVYARAPGNIIKSVVHQHTHLIYLDNKPKRALFYLKQPHILIYK